MLYTVVAFISSVLFVVLLINVFYFFVFALSGKAGRVKVSPDASTYKNMVVFIPAYKEDAVILHSAQAAIQQHYPADKYTVIVIADHLLPETISTLRQIPVEVIEVQFEKSTKIKSLNFAVNALTKSYDSVVVLDSDNIMQDDFLSKLNRELQAGYRAVQGHRVAKNEDTDMAFLDAMSEEINNHLFRKGHYILGFSSALIGSAMAFDFALFQRLIKGIHSVGEDKELELALLKEKVKIAYAEDAWVYDEKVQNMEVFGNQRKRWLASQLNIFKTYFFPSFIELFRHGNIDYFNKAFQSALIPRVLLLGFLTVMAFMSLFLPFAPAAYYWIGLWLLYIITLMMAVPGRFYNRKLWNAVLRVPSVFLKMFLLLFRLKGAGKTFVHTPHNTVTVKKD
jgi:cellulose synthase/poly-beta-1,6-N-acetylglucosamine synthase-like glycosyltransferase